MPPIARADVDEVLLEHFEQVSLDLDATRAHLAGAAGAALDEATARREGAERELMLASGRLGRVKRAFQDGKLDPEDWREQRIELEAEKEAAEAELARCVLREAETAETVRAVDAQTDVVARLAVLRDAVAGRVVNAAADIEAARAALTAAFSAVTLVMSDDGERDLVTRVRIDPAWQASEKEAETLRRAAAGDLPAGRLPSNGRRVAVELEPINNVETTEVISPGTANTSLPSSSARSAVMSAPLRSRASTTTVAAHRPATMRLRAGKRHGAGSTPGAYSETTQTRRASSACAAG